LARIKPESSALRNAAWTLPPGIQTGGSKILAPGIG